MREKAKNITANAVVIAIISLVIFIGNTQYRQWSQYERGNQALAVGDYIAAIADYESAIHMYTPGSPLVTRAAEKLWSIGETLERQGEIDKALIAYRSLRSAYYSTHSLTRPGQSWIASCDAKIAKLAKPEPPAPTVK